MAPRSFLSFIALFIALLLNSGWAAAQNASQIYRHTRFTLSYERGQIRLTLAEGAASSVKEMRLEIYSFNGGKVFDSGASGKQPIVWDLQDQLDRGAPDGKYILSIHLKLDGVESDVVFGRLTKSAQKVSFTDALRLYEGSSANGAREFFKLVAELCPDDASAWLWYGQTVYKLPEIFLDPPAAPAPPMPPRPVGRQQAPGVTIDRSVDSEPSPSDLKEAVFAFQKALNLATDCRTKDLALNYLAATYSALNEDVELTEMLLRRAESECSTKASKVASYFSLGVKHWNCAYSLSTAYTDAEKLTYDPFHYRNFTNPADKQKFERCLTNGLEYIEKALALDPGYVDAIFYKGLLCREKQKSTEGETERGQWAEEARKLAAKGIALQKLKEGRQ